MDLSRTKKMVMMAIFGALAWLISMFSFPLLPSAGFLKIDFSDIIILLGMCMLGLRSGIGIAAVRSLLSYVVTFGELGYPIGDTAAFIASLAFTVPIYQYLKKHSQPNYLLAGFLGTISLTSILTVLNYFVLFPLYQQVMGLQLGSMTDYLLLAVIPFNLLKGSIISILFFTVFHKMWVPIKSKR